MKARFPQLSQEVGSSQALLREMSQSARRAPEYHHCKLCNTSFSSMERLIRPTQESICNKPPCRHSEKIFLSKNQLQQHLRKECQKQMHRRSSSSSSPASSPASSPSRPHHRQHNRCRHRAISPPPQIYEAIRNYLTVEDLSRVFGRRCATTKSSITITIDDRLVGPFVSPHHIARNHQVLTDSFEIAKKEHRVYI